jgi:hypothetical protein
MNDISDNSSNTLVNGGTVANSGIPKDGTGMSLLIPQFLLGLQAHLPIRCQKLIQKMQVS